MLLHTNVWGCCTVLCTVMYCTLTVLYLYGGAGVQVVGVVGRVARGLDLDQSEVSTVVT